MQRACASERQKWRLMVVWLAALTFASCVHRLWPQHREPAQDVLGTVMVGTGQQGGDCAATNPATTFPRPEDVVEALLDGPLDAADARLVKWVAGGAGGRLLPPSSLPYNITRDNVGSWRESGVHQFYVKTIAKYFEKKRGGFFVESGALDGYLLSSTLHLEEDLGWGGLLVEPRPDMFQLLLHHHRKAHAARFCLSEHSYPYKTIFWLSPEYLHNSAAFSAVGSAVYDRVDDSIKEAGTLVEVHCMPLATLLQALGRTHVDLWVLDVEGVEWGVVDTFPFHRITVDMVATERKSFRETGSYVQLIESKGFRLVANFTDDYIFVRKGSVLDVNAEQ